MVLTEVSYYLNYWGGFDGYAYAAVFDPWPGRGARILSPAEFTRIDFGTGGLMRFLASARLVEQHSPSDPRYCSTPSSSNVASVASISASVGNVAD
jgi:hypothetical protein